MPDGSKGPVIAWIWARTVTCPNPACSVEAPLVRTWWLSKKNGQETVVIPTVVGDPQHKSGLSVRYAISSDGTITAGTEPAPTVGRTGGHCVACDSPMSLSYIRSEGVAKRIGAKMLAIVAPGRRRRVYLEPDEVHLRAAELPRPSGPSSAPLSTHPQYMGAPRYGYTTASELFTDRQLVVLTTFSEILQDVRTKVTQDALAAQEEANTEDAAYAYANAVVTYLSLTLSKLTNISSSMTSWMNDRAALRETFSMQALSMVWDFAEANVLSDSGGGWDTTLLKVAKVIDDLPAYGSVDVTQIDAADRQYETQLLSTDPPYYDNVPYADLSDYFYPWLRSMLRDIYPNLFGTIQVPKEHELVVNHLRHRSRKEADEFFESGFREIFEKVRESKVKDDFPVTVYYAFRQSEKGVTGTSSTGWQTFLDGLLTAGWRVTATWPMRTEGAGRQRAIKSNALASSIVLSLRPRDEDAPTTDRRGFLAALHQELPRALKNLQHGRISPVDLPQAALGPGMSVFSMYSAVLEPDGSRMSVRSALERINDILDQVLDQQETDFDPTTRFAIAWYRQHGYGTGKYGDADNLARARNTAVDALATLRDPDVARRERHAASSERPRRGIRRR